MTTVQVGRNWSRFFIGIVCYCLPVKGPRYPINLHRIYRDVGPSAIIGSRAVDCRNGGDLSTRGKPIEAVEFSAIASASYPTHHHHQDEYCFKTAT